MMSSCCTLRLKRRRAFSRDSPSCSLTSAKLTHPQTRPAGPNSYYRELTPSQAKAAKLWAQMTFLFLYLHLILRHPCFPRPGLRQLRTRRSTGRLRSAKVAETNDLTRTASASTRHTG